MNNRIKTFIIFATGLGIGAGAGIYYTKSKYDQVLDAELEEVRAHYSAKIDELSEKVKGIECTAVAVKEAKEEIVEEPVKVEKAEEIVEKMNYNTISEEKKTPKKKTTAKSTKKKTVEADIFVIEPNDFTNRDNGYDKVTLTYFEEDDRFLDAYDESFDDGHKVIGAENLTRFGEYESGVLYVRNRLTETDYEVILETRPYEEYVADEYGE